MKALLFDMDGVLVDVSRSYRRAIQETVSFFSEKTVSGDTIQEYKLQGGWNDDWALTKKILIDMGIRPGMERIIEVFQEIYLGKSFDGLIRKETWLLDTSVLESIHPRFVLGIVTGRPRPEALHALQSNKTSRFFQVCITQSDLPPGRGKPDPLGLEMAMEKLGCREGYYAGDAVDDMKAASSAGLVPIGVIPAGQKGTGIESRLYQCGARSVLQDINAIEEVLE